MPNVESLLRDHVTLAVDCIDRLYLNGNVPKLQRPQNLWWYLVEHRGYPVPSPPVLRKLVDAFVANIRAFAEREHVPIIHFAKGARKEDVVRKRLCRFKHLTSTSHNRAPHAHVPAAPCGIVRDPCI